MIFKSFIFLTSHRWTRYVDTFEPEPEIDLNEVAAEIRKLQSEIKDIDAELKPFFDELGLDFPFDVEGK